MSPPLPKPRFGPPSYPLRPVNGGPLPKALPKSGEWSLNGKYNGWRAWVHAPTRTMWNRQLEPLSITHEFTAALEILHRLPFEWVDVEALERRHKIGQGTLVLLDAPAAGRTWYDRQYFIHAAAGLHGIPTHSEVNKPLANDSVYLPMTWETAAGPQLWTILQQCNQALGCDFWEGLVAKRTDSLYPLQLRSPNQEFPYWVKHRWAF